MNPLQRRRAWLLAELRALPGFDDETFRRATGQAVQGMAVLWRANRG